MTRDSALVLELLAEFFFLILDEPADHLTPQRLGELRRQPLLLRPRAHPVDHLLNTPRHTRFGGRLLELPGTIDIGEALAYDLDHALINPIHLRPHLFHVTPLFSLAWRHTAIP